MIKSSLVICSVVFVFFNAHAQSQGDTPSEQAPPEVEIPVVEPPPVVRPHFKDPTRQLQSLVYYPHAHEHSFVATPSATVSDSGTAKNYLGVEIRSTDTNTYQLTMTLSYGFTDYMRGSISESEMFQQTVKTTDKTTGNVTTDHSNGPSSPTFVATKRVVQNQLSKFFMDVAVGTTPQLATNEKGTNGQTGNNFSTSWTASLTAPLYWLVGHHDLEVEPQVIYHFSGESDGPTPATSDELNDYWTSSLALADRYHFSDTFFTELLVTTNFPYADRSTNVSTANSTDTSYNINFSPEIEFGYLFNTNFLMSAAITYTTGSRTTTPATTNPTQESSNNLTATISGRYVF